MSSTNNPILKVKSLKKTYHVSRAFKAALQVQALRGVDFEVRAGETLAVVGESGCGKSTLAKVLMKIEEPTEGHAEVTNHDIKSLTSKQLPSHLQMIFQDPYSSLNPRKKILDVIAEPLRIRGDWTEAKIVDKVREVAQLVGLRPEILNRYPHMLSGGQRQRVGIARALTTEPKAIICDEPVSALDVSVQAQVLNLLLDLQQQKNLSYLFISHDLGVVRFLAHRVAVMYLGRFVEIADRDTLFQSARHPYTQLLLKSTPNVKNMAADAAQEVGDLPSPLNPPSGCSFHTRCPHATAECKEKTPELRAVGASFVACHWAEKIPAFQSQVE